MTIFCLGSINVDYFYRVPHVPALGETLAATEMNIGLGGKGANQSVAAAKAGASVVHIGAIGPDSSWTLDRLADYGVDTSQIAVSTEPTGHAIINVADSGENAIVILPGANRTLMDAQIESGLATAKSGDVLLLQNETNGQAHAVQVARARDMTVLYSAAPFSADAVRAILAEVDMLLLNALEAEQLEKGLEQRLNDLPVGAIVVTLGAEGAKWIDTKRGDVWTVQGEKVDAVDTTGAGDTFAGYLAAAITEGMDPEEALSLAGRAAALKVTRHGTADAIPTRSEVDAFRP